MRSSTAFTTRSSHQSVKRVSARIWALIVPAVSVIMFSLIITLPWGMGEGMLYVPPLLIMAAIFAWVVRRPRAMPSIFVFMVGVAVDVVTASPIGFWAFLFLVSYTAALHIVQWEFAWVTWATVVGYAVTSVVVGGMAWALTSVYFGHVVDWAPVAESVKIACMMGPVIALVVRTLDHRMHAPISTSGPKQVRP